MQYPASQDPEIKEYHKGKRDGYELAAKWLNEALIKIKFDNIDK